MAFDGIGPTVSIDYLNQYRKGAVTDDRWIAHLQASLEALVDELSAKFPAPDAAAEVSAGGETPPSTDVPAAPQ